MRATNSVASRKRHHRVLKRAKGFLESHRLYRKAKETLLKSGQKEYIGRKQKKRTFRSLWITRLSAAIKKENLNYSQFINKLKTQKIHLNRKVLSEIAISDPQTFAKIIKEVK